MPSPRKNPAKKRIVRLILPNSKRVEKLDKTGQPAEVPLVDRPVEDIFLKDRDGMIYRPLSYAAKKAQVPKQTYLNWIKKKVLFDGQPLKAKFSKALGSYVVSDDSISRANSRFVKWPSNEPAGKVIIGDTHDQSGYLGMLEAANLAGVSKRTMWLWSSQGKAPTQMPLDVIKCTTSDYFYIREMDVVELAKLTPLPRGRRPQDAASQLAEGCQPLRTNRRSRVEP